MKIVSWIGFVLGLIALILGVIYCLTNNSGHSSMDPLVGSKFFIPLLMFGILHLILSSGRTISAWLLSLIGTGGAGFGLFIHKMAIMQEYDYWAYRGLEAQNPYSAILVLSYAAGVSLLFLLTVIIFKSVTLRRNG